jgi:hypothetical protein
MRHKIAFHNDIKPVRKAKICRTPKTLRFKIEVLDFLKESLKLVCVECGFFKPAHLYSNDCTCGQKDCEPRVRFAYQVADEAGITEAMLSKYIKNDSEEWRELATDRPRCGKIHSGVRFNKEANDELYQLFLNRRKETGQPTDGYWLVHTFGEILAAKWPNQRHPQSNRWLSRFCKRYHIGSLLKTEKKNKSVSERLPEITDFHRDIYLFQNHMPQICPIWGAYRPENIWNADHIPLPFSIDLKRSLNPKGEDCWIAVTGPSGLEKRQATLHLCIRADGEQFMPPFILFSGAGFITADEVEYLDSLPNIRWDFQENAWANAVYSRKWLRHFVSQIHQKCPGEHHLLFLDKLSAQEGKVFNKIAMNNRIFPFPIPPNCTDVLQPVDHNVGARLKFIMNSFYKMDLERNFDRWRDYKNNSSLTQSMRRMLMAFWLNEAWDFLKHDRNFLYASFARTVLVKKDGANSLRLRGVDNYKPPFPCGYYMCSIFKALDVHAPFCFVTTQARRLTSSSRNPSLSSTYSSPFLLVVLFF